MSRNRRKTDRSRRVREPLQVYLTAAEREQLDRLAQQTGLSRAEVLRRGLRSFAAEQQAGDSPMLKLIDELASADLPADLARRHDDYLAEAYLDTHEPR